METEQLKRIADALEEILRMVKADQERSKKYLEEKKIKEFPLAYYGIKKLK